MNPPETLITDIMEENIKFVHVDAEPEDMLETLAKYDLIAVPVLDRGRPNGRHRHRRRRPGALPAADHSKNKRR